MKLHIYYGLFLLLAMGCVTTTPDAPAIGLTPLFEAWVAIGGILLTISLLLMLLVYVFGNILMNERMKAWAKIELFEIIYSVIILVFALYAVGAANSVVTGVVAGSDPYTSCVCDTNFQNIPGSIYYGIEQCHIRLSLYFLSTVFKETSDLGLSTYISYIVTATLADAQLSMENVIEPAGMFTWTPWRGIWAMGNTVKAEVFSKSILIMTVTMFQEVLIRFIATSLFPVLFVLGVVLRAFTFTRRLGGLLMAIALSLFFIFPMFYAFGALIINQIKIQNYDPSDPELHDPPIANHFYIRGEVPLLGYGPAGRDRIDLEAEERAAREAMYTADVTGQSAFCGNIRVSRTLNEGMIRSQTLAEQLRPFDIYADVDVESDEFKEQFEELQQREEAWFGEISKVAWYDRFWIGGMFKAGGIVDTLARLAFFSVFFALLGALATIAAIKNLSIMLGGETEIAGLTHLI